MKAASFPKVGSILSSRTVVHPTKLLHLPHASSKFNEKECQLCWLCSMERKGNFKLRNSGEKRLFARSCF